MRWLKRWWAGKRCDWCAHRSHWLGLPCLRYRTYDGYCGHHNYTCWEKCP